MQILLERIGDYKIMLALGAAADRAEIKGRSENILSAQDWTAVPQVPVLRRRRKRLLGRIIVIARNVPSWLPNQNQGGKQTGWLA